MGCVHSKRASVLSKASAYSPLKPTVDLSVDSGSCHSISLASSTHGILNNLSRCSAEKDTLVELYDQNIGDHIHADFIFSSASSRKHAINVCPLQRSSSENVASEQRLCQGDNQSDSTDMEVINTRELMKGLEDPAGPRTPSPLHQNNHGNRKITIPKKSISFKTLAQSHHSAGTGIDSPVWRKYYIQESDPHVAHGASLSTPNINLHPFEDPVLIRAASTSNFWMDVDVLVMSSIKPLEVGCNSGLKLLLSPANSSPCFSSSFTGKNPGCHAASVSFDGADVDGTIKGLTTISPLKIPDVNTSFSRQTSVTSMEGPNDSDGLLFDPSLMATFEQAVESTVKGDEWLQIFGDPSNYKINTSSTSAFSTSSSDSGFDSDIVPHSQLTEKRSVCSKIMSADQQLQMAKERLLGKFDEKCPPRGEGKLVLYFTSLRGIRKTYEDCCSVRLILRNLGIQVDERDVWMHAKFKEELKEVFMVADADGDEGADADGQRHCTSLMPQLPQLFIKGRHIGSAEEVKQLHEDEVLAELVEGIPERTDLDRCEACGDVRFMPCISCSGSCKVLVCVEGGAYGMQAAARRVEQRCPECNENGLIMCLACSSS